MVTAAAGGGLVETSEHSVTSPRRASPGHGAWAKAGGRTYRFTFREFVANQDGSNLSTVVVRAEAVLSKSGDEFNSSGNVEVLNGAGHVVFSAPQTGRAVRISADD